MASRSYPRRQLKTILLGKRIKLVNNSNFHTKGELVHCRLGKTNKLMKYQKNSNKETGESQYLLSVCQTSEHKELREQIKEVAGVRARELRVL